MAALARIASPFGITDLVVAGTLSALTGYQLLNVTLSAAPIRAPRPAPSAAGPLIPGVASA